MNKEFDVRDEYAKDRDQHDENRYFLIGLGGMILAMLLDWALFQWIYTGVHHVH